MLCYKRTYQSHTKKKVMDFKKINSKSKIGFVIVIIFCMTILLTFFDLGLNFVYNSEKYDKESNTLSQSQLKKNLPFENEYLGYKKKNPVLPNQGLQVQKPDKKNPEYEESNKTNVLNNNNKNFDRAKKIEKSKVNNDKKTLPANLKNIVDSVKVFDNPEMTVNFLHEGLKKINSNNNSNFNNVLNLVDHTYDSEKMLKLIIGADWKKLERDKKKELITVFKRYISKNYLDRFSKIQEISFEDEEKEKISSEVYLIKSNLVINKEIISIDYLLSFNKNSWKIFDVLLDGAISEIATKKSEFRIFIKEKKIDSLIDALKKFNNQMPS